MTYNCEFDFCIDVKCPLIETDETGYYSCPKTKEECVFTARQFYTWLIERSFYSPEIENLNSFEIAKNRM